MTNKIDHKSVLLNEAVDALKVAPNSWYIDATFGGGGHTKLIIGQGGKVLGFDWDSQAIEAGHDRFSSEIAQGKLRLSHDNFSHLQEVVEQKHADLVNQIHGILFDFGTNTTQLMSADRGFSFEGDGELDMRMDKRLGVMAKDILALVPQNQLAQLFINEGGERQGNAIAKAIKNSPQAITTTKQLADLVKAVKRGHRDKLHPATKVFQALRIAVNSEISNIEEALPQAYSLLQPGGHIVTIAFHEGEDRVAKTVMKNWSEKSLGVIENKSVITPEESELEKNPRSRSAKMRIFRKEKQKK